MKGQTILAILIALLLVINSVALVTYAGKSAPKAEVIEVTNTVESSYNDTLIKSDLAVIKAEILEDSNWETSAIALATSEMKEKSYRNVYDALVDLEYSIVDKEDISNVVIKDSEVDDFDVDEKDATVIQELKVYFEDADGDHIKAYLNLTTEIVDNEVDDTEYVIA